MDLFFGDQCGTQILVSGQPQHEPGGQAEQLHERPGDQCQSAHRPRHQARDPLRIELGDALGHQLPGDDRKIGDHDHHQRGCADFAGPLFEPHAL